jgi:hypothetical protein
MGSDLALAYVQYVRVVLRSVSLCGPQVRLEIRLPSFYGLDHNMTLDQREMKSLSAILLPEVASLEISFPSMSKGRLLVCSHPFGKYKLTQLLSGLLRTMVLPYANIASYSSLRGFN